MAGGGSVGGWTTGGNARGASGRGCTGAATRGTRATVRSSWADGLNGRPSINDGATKGASERTLQYLTGASDSVDTGGVPGASCTRAHVGIVEHDGPIGEGVCAVAPEKAFFTRPALPSEANIGARSSEDGEATGRSWSVEALASTKCALVLLDELIFVRCGEQAPTLALVSAGGACNVALCASTLGPLSVRSLFPGAALRSAPGSLPCSSWMRTSRSA